MRDAYADYSMLPTEIDLERLKALEADGRVEAENGVWVVLRYPPTVKTTGAWKWCEYSLIVNCPGVPPRGAPFELKNLAALLTFMGQLEQERVK